MQQKENDGVLFFIVLTGLLLGGYFLYDIMLNDAVHFTVFTIVMMALPVIYLCLSLVVRIKNKQFEAN